MHPLRRLVLAVAAASALSLGAATTANAQLCIPGLGLPGCPQPPTQPTKPAPAPAPAPVTPPKTPIYPYSEPARACPLEVRTPPGGFVGMAGDDVLVSGPKYRRCELSAQVRSGVAIVRTSFLWRSVERAKGAYDFSLYDAYVAAVASHGIQIMPVLYYPPTFRSSRPASARPSLAPPSSNAAFAAFAKATAARYGPTGSFWAARPDVPRIPIRSWQIWNEPNLKVYWPPRPNARAYVRLAAAAGRAIKSVDPKASIVTAGMPESRIGVPLARWIPAMYRAGARRVFDAIAVNPYAPRPSKTVAEVKRVRGLLRDAGDSRVPLWLTEIGWASAGPKHPFRSGPERQATYAAKALRDLHSKRKQLRIRGAFWFSWRDLVPYRTDFWGLHTGLYSVGGEAKPAAEAFRQTAPALR